MKKVLSWFSQALSDDNAPSSKRLIAFLISLTVCYCEIYHTHKRGAFDTTHLGYLLVTILVLAGVATIPQIVDLVRGGNSASQSITKTPDTTTIVTKTQVSDPDK